MRKSLALFFTAILLINLFGYFISFTIQQCEIKGRVAHLLESNDLKRAQQITLSQQQYDKLVSSSLQREFVLNGVLYDIVKTEAVSDKVLCTVYCDREETDLVDSFITFISLDSHKEQSKNNLPLFTLLEFVFTSNPCLHPDATACCNISLLTHNLQSLSLDSATPPPDLLFS